MKKCIFNDWNYKKHAKLVTSLYLVLYAIDMTVTYVLIKKINNKKKIQTKC